MQANITVLLDTIVKTRRPPRVREEHHRHSLSEVVQLQSARTNRVHDGCVVDRAHGDQELARAQEKVGVRCGSLGGVS